jgi:hypothetical protein
MSRYISFSDKLWNRGSSIVLFTRIMPTFQVLRIFDTLTDIKLGRLFQTHAFLSWSLELNLYCESPPDRVIFHPAHAS